MEIVTESFVVESPTQIDLRKVRSRCGLCESCQRADCGECRTCRDKKKFGGPGRLKQACLNRVCFSSTKLNSPHRNLKEIQMQQPVAIPVPGEVPITTVARQTDGALHPRSEYQESQNSFLTDVVTVNMQHVAPPAVAKDAMVSKPRKNKKRNLDAPILHTPFCGKGCMFEHHKILVKILNCTNHKSDDQNRASDCAVAIREYGRLMGPSANLADPLFPCPVVHIVAMLGKIRVMDKLAQMPEFDFGCRMSPTGETALHKMIQYLDKAMKEPSRRCCLVKIKETFRVALARLINKKPELFVLQDNRGDTPFHFTVRSMLSWQASHKTGKRQEYFAFCLKSMISLLKSLDSGHLLPCSTKDVLSISNKWGDNFIQMLDKLGLDDSIVSSVYDEMEPDLLKDLRQEYGGKEDREPSMEEKKQRLDELIGQLREANQLRVGVKDEVISCDSDSDSVPPSPPSELYGTVEDSAPVFGQVSKTDGEARLKDDKSCRRESALNSPSVDIGRMNGQSLSLNTEARQDLQTKAAESCSRSAASSDNSVSVAGAILQSPLDNTEKQRLIMETLQGLERKSSEQDTVLLNERKRRLEFIQKTRSEKEEALTTAREKRRKLLEEAEKLEETMKHIEQELKTTWQEEQERKEAFLQAEKKCQGYMFQVDECRRALESFKQRPLDSTNQ